MANHSAFTLQEGFANSRERAGRPLCLFAALLQRVEPGGCLAEKRSRFSFRQFERNASADGQPAIDAGAAVTDLVLNDEAGGPLWSLVIRMPASFRLNKLFGPCQARRWHDRRKQRSA
jgi:hypothetical protein